MCNIVELKGKYIQYIKNNGLSGNTVLNYSKDLQQFLEHLQGIGVSSVSDITPQIVLSYIAKLGEVFSPNTTSRKLSAIRSFLNFCVVSGALKTNPAQHIPKPKVPQKVPVSLSQEEAKTILNIVESGQNNRSLFVKLRNTAILHLFLNCGLRRNELSSLKLDDLCLKYNRVLVHGKGNKERVVYINPSTCAALLEYMAEREKINGCICDNIFITMRGKPLTNPEINDLFNSVYKQAGLDKKGYGVHTMRKTCATLMYNNKVDIKTIRDILGHSDIKTTMHYVGISEENKQEAGSKNFLN